MQKNKTEELNLQDALSVIELEERFEMTAAANLRCTDTSNTPCNATCQNTKTAVESQTVS